MKMNPGPNSTFNLRGWTFDMLLLDMLLLMLLLSSSVRLLAQMAPHHFSGITALPNQTVLLSLEGSVSAAFRSYYDSYVLETSPNLTDWIPLVTLVRTSASHDALTFIDTNTLQSDQRFYRTFTNDLVTPFQNGVNL